MAHTASGSPRIAALASLADDREPPAAPKHVPRVSRARIEVPAAFVPPAYDGGVCAEANAPAPPEPSRLDRARRFVDLMAEADPPGASSASMAPVDDGPRHTVTILVRGAEVSIDWGAFDEQPIDLPPWDRSTFDADGDVDAERPYWRPSRRSDCGPGGRNGERPCPYMACKHHLAWWWIDPGLDTDPDAKVPNVRLHDLPSTCVLDVVDAALRAPSDQEQRDGAVATHEGISLHVGVTPQRVHQIEKNGVVRCAESYLLLEAGVPMNVILRQRKHTLQRRPNGERVRQIVSTKALCNAIALAETEDDELPEGDEEDWLLDAEWREAED